MAFKIEAGSASASLRDTMQRVCRRDENDHTAGRRKRQGLQTLALQTNDCPSDAPKAIAPRATIGGLPARQGLYDPRNEHDACGVGFVAHMKGQKSHQIVKDGLFILENLTHRGAVGADPLMGDGAGILVQIPDRFFREEMAKQGVTLPKAGEYAVGHIFFPRDPERIEHYKKVIVDVIGEEGQQFLGFRDVPVDNASLSKAADIAATEPHHVQVFMAPVAKPPPMPNSNAVCS